MTEKKIFLVLKKPSAFIPLGLAFSALLLLVGHIIIFGVSNSTDEGTAAHIFQILMAVQAFFILYFVIKWLLAFPRQVLFVLLLQAILIFSSFAVLFFLEN